MSRLRKASIDLARESRFGAESRRVSPPPTAVTRRGRSLDMGTMIAAIDAAIGRDDDDGSGEWYIASTFAVVWAALGYVVWIVLVLVARLVRVVVILVTMPFRRERR